MPNRYNPLGTIKYLLMVELQKALSKNQPDTIAEIQSHLDGLNSLEEADREEDE
jgi:hypothetical protein